SAKERATPDVERLRAQALELAGEPAHPALVAQLERHPVSRPDRDGRERTRSRVARALVVHRDAEEPGRRRGLDLAVDLLEVPPHRLLAIVDAEDRLKTRRRRFLGAMADH